MVHPLAGAAKFFLFIQIGNYIELSFLRWSS